MMLEYGSPEWRNEQRERQEKLNGCLMRLCEREIQSHDDLVDIAGQLLEVYSDDEFRHRYSDVMGVVHNTDGMPDLDLRERADYVALRGTGLAQGLFIIFTHNCNGECGEPEKCPVRALQKKASLNKLYDHANLEARRASYDAEDINESLNKLKEARRALQDASEKLEQAKAAAEEAGGAASEASENAKSLQLEIVSVLGVFSAVVLAFNASVSFTTSSISAVDATPPFNVAFIVSVVGLILFNCLYGAFALIYRILRPKKSPDSLLDGKRIAGIELTAVACVAFLGTLTYTNDDIFSTNQILVLGAIVLMMLAIGISFLIQSGDHRHSSQDREG